MKPEKVNEETSVRTAQAQPGSGAASGSAASCEWVKDEYGTKCGRPAVGKDSKHGKKYCQRHGEIVSKAFGPFTVFTPLNDQAQAQPPTATPERK